MILIKTIHKDNSDEELLIPGAMLSFGMSTTVSASSKGVKFKNNDPNVYPADNKKVTFPKYFLSIHIHDVFGIDAKSIVDVLGSNHYHHTQKYGGAWANLSFESKFMIEPVAIFVCHAESNEDALFPSSFVKEFLTAGYIESFSYESPHGAKGDGSGILNLSIADCRLTDRYTDNVKWSEYKNGFYKAKGSKGNAVKVFDKG